jgi:hypothetical protein
MDDKDTAINFLSSVSNDETLDENTRADASDLLLRYGSDNEKEDALNTIKELGGDMDTLYENSQNVHTEEIEKSVINIIEHITMVPLDKTITIKYISDQLGEKTTDKNSFFLGLRRIKMDRGKYCCDLTLQEILIYVWNYISTHEHFEEMEKRMCEELTESINTCATGFIARIANVVSGFGDFSVSIGYLDQIVSNVFGRINARIRAIDEDSSGFWNSDTVKVWIRNDDEGIKIYNTILSENPNITIDGIVGKYLEINASEKIMDCVDILKENVVNEMTDTTASPENKMFFTYFLSKVIPEIKIEMYDEFSKLITNDQFDVYFRDAISSYEGHNIVVNKL